MRTEVNKNIQKNKSLKFHFLNKKDNFIELKFTK